MEEQFLYNTVLFLVIWTTWFLFPTLARTRMTMIPHPRPCHGEDGGDEVVDVGVDVVVAGRIRLESWPKWSPTQFPPNPPTAIDLGPG